MFCFTKQNWSKSNYYRMNMKFSNYFSNKWISIINNFKKIVTFFKKTNKELIIVYFISCIFAVLLNVAVASILDYLINRYVFMKLLIFFFLMMAFLILFRIIIYKRNNIFNEIFLCVF